MANPLVWNGLVRRDPVTHMSRIHQPCIVRAFGLLKIMIGDNGHYCFSIEIAFSIKASGCFIYSSLVHAALFSLCSLVMVNPISIHVLEDAIVLQGNQQESAGKLLQGKLILDLKEPIKVRSVNLRFYGKMKVSWREGVGHGQDFHQQERTIMSHKWQFVPQEDEAFSSSSSSSTTHHQNHHHHTGTVGVRRPNYTLRAGRHEWPFALPLSGDLPQSVEATNGRVIYQLKAMVERPFYLQNFSLKRPITIVRTMQLDDFPAVDTWEVHHTWEDKIEYDINMPTRIYSLGEHIPISFDIKPLDHNLRVRRLVATLKEYRAYRAKEHSTRHTWECTSNVVVNPNPLERWNHVLDLNIPNEPPHVHCDSENDMMKIQHRVKFSIYLQNADGQKSEVRCAAVIMIVPSLVQQAAHNTLPPYQPTTSSSLYRTASNAVSIRGATSRTTVASSSGDQQEPLARSYGSSAGIWWHGMDLSRVPSYNTAAQQEPASLSSSLPPYETIIPPR
ncbi:arrestin domain-containing protein [Lichtheimia corymbifera JMRC:FSU:9682]|uniref:Arrestin domain-containing protein n=1 Tax=Lichtheimia corymbifera JMRC:FSU:9682 TaxID=1263082 RepID=A0A068RP15_9FUNG|nr:arrestin domain-containing protein [Lichtheimia corymbifera JMRC:FSU:9682]